MTLIAPLGMLGQAADRTPVSPSRLCQRGVDRLLLLYAALWVVYVITAFRMPWTPLNESEAPTSNAMRLVFLTLGFVLAAKRLLFTGTVGAAISMHMGGLILGLLMLVSVCWSLDPTLTIKRSLVYLFGYVFLVSVTHASRWPLRFYMRTVLYGVGGVAWIAVAAYYIFPRNCTELSFRPGLAGLSGHPNVFGPCLEMAWGLGLGYAAASRRQRLWKYVMMAGILVALCMTDSVTAIVATAVATVVYVLMTVTSYRAGALMLCVVGGALLACVVGSSAMQAMFFDAIGRDISMSGRDTLWRDVFREAVKTPVFGSGYGAFWSEGRGREIAVTWNPRQAHNAYLDVFVDLGIVGLLLVLSVVHWRVITIWQSFAGRRGTVQRNAVAAYVSMAIGLCCIGAFGESYLLKLDKFQFFVLFWGIIVFENRDGNHVVAECEATKRPMVRV